MHAAASLPLRFVTFNSLPARPLIFPLQLAMATVLNPNAPLFFPTTTFAPAGDELSVHYPPPRPPLLNPFSALLPQRYEHSCISKGTIFIHPSLIYYQSPSISVFPNFSYYIPPSKCFIEPEATALPRVGDGELGGVVEKQRVSELSLRTVSSSRFAIRGMRGIRHGNQLMKRSYKQWVRKSASLDDNSPQETNFCLPDDLHFTDEMKSTVMIKNVPNKISRKQLLDLLDQHCRNENMKNTEEDADTALSEFDFLYLPMDFISGNNLGYAFVNFTTPAAATKFYQDVHLKPWNDTFGSRKICEITHAKIQGLEELVKHFRRSIFTCSSSEYLPVYFHPSRDGSRDSPEHLIGKLLHRSTSG
ncbi:protein MEI2-like 6 [Phalaenopsis equestris]|uniref:protein MEI2-like 6 n=1 Tax=Phalaenopsis equestris TaxID=78828 RepID=UPI0009E2AAE6|nr:protein MEI2-like 6 [Phalaenopsis equestris]